MTVHFIGVGPGAPDLLTLRARDIIARTPVCLYAGSLIPSEILEHCPADAHKINTAPLTLEEITDICVENSRQGQDIVRLHSGDLSIWSAMAEQVRELKARQIDVTMTPGIPSFAAAASALGAELTLPGRTQSVVLTRTSGRASAMPEAETIEAFAATRATLAIHLSIHALDSLIDRLTPFYGADCSVAVAYRVTWPDEQIFRGTLQTISALIPEDVQRTALILVGPAVGDSSFSTSSLYAAHYDRRFRPLDARDPANPFDSAPDEDIQS